MKKIMLVVAVTLTVLIGFLTICPVAYAQSDTLSAEKILNDFVTANPERVAGSEGEYNAGSWLYAYFSEQLGLETIRQDFRIGGDYTGEVLSSSNIIAHIPSAQQSNDRIVLGAHYDNASSGEGVYDNGSGIAVLLALATRLASHTDLPYNIDLVCFGSEEVGLLGSSAYCEALSADAQNVLLMINFDVVSSGDYVYLYGEDVDTDLRDFVLQKGQGNDNGITIYAKPHHKDIAIGSRSPYSIYPYTQTAQLSDHSSLRILGVPTLFIYSGNYSNVGYRESDTNAPIMHSNRDTLEYHENNLQDKYVLQMQAVVDAVYDTLIDPTFLPVVQNARTQLVPMAVLQVWPSILISLCIVAIVILFALRHLNRLNKSIAMGDYEVKVNKSFFKSSNKDDIYDL